MISVKISALRDAGAVTALHFCWTASNPALRPNHPFRCAPPNSREAFDRPHGASSSRRPSGRRRRTRWIRMHAPHTPRDDPSTAKQLAPSQVLAVAWRIAVGCTSANVWRARRIECLNATAVPERPVAKCFLKWFAQSEVPSASPVTNDCFDRISNLRALCCSRQDRRSLSESPVRRSSG